MMEIYPAVDLRNGACVRLVQGDFERETVYDNAPAELAARYADQGASWLHVVDLDGARAGAFANLRSIEAICSRVAIKVQAGGGVRSEEDIRRLLDAGVARVVVGSAAVTQPREVAEWITRLGGERLCIALDVKPDMSGEYFLTTKGWTEIHSLSLTEGLDALEPAPLSHVLCTDVGRDGTMEGPNTDLYGRLAEDHPKLAIQASGGVRSIDDLQAVAASGAAATVVGTALLEGKFQLAEAIECLRGG